MSSIATVSGEELAERAAAAVRKVIAEAEERARQILAEAETEAAEIRSGAQAEVERRLEAARRALAGESPTTQPVAAPVVEPASEAGEDEAGSGAEPEVVEPAVDETAARLIAMRLAVGGESREAVTARLAADYPDLDADPILDDVFSRVSSG